MFQSQNVLFDKHHLGLELAHGIILYQYWRFRLQKRHTILNTCDLLSYLSAGRLELGQNHHRLEGQLDFDRSRQIVEFFKHGFGLLYQSYLILPIDWSVSKTLVGKCQLRSSKIL